MHTDLQRCDSLGSDSLDGTPVAERRRRISWGDHEGVALEHVETIERRKPRPGFLAQTLSVLREELFWGFKRPNDGDCSSPGAEEEALAAARANAAANVTLVRQLGALLSQT
jgi:hypothetical protein